MKAVILAGGLGTRLSEETLQTPKPMVEIGGKPILWHIMKSYSFHGVNEFIICCGYRGYVIKEYFANYFLHMSDVTFDMRKNSMEVHSERAEPWRVTLVDTGADSATGGRLKLVSNYIDDDAFCFTYGDGLSSHDIGKSIEFHRGHGKFATVTAVKPPGRFGAIESEKNKVTRFNEKPKGDGGLINGGFFVLQPEALDYIPDAASPWEDTPLGKLVAEDQLMTFEHKGFWQPMDTLREKNLLQDLWDSGEAPWKKWDE